MTSREPLKKVTIRLKSKQYQRLLELYPNVGYNSILRALVDRHLSAVEVKIAARLATITPELIIEDLGDFLDIPQGERE